MVVGPITVITILTRAPESPRYLILKGKKEAAYSMLTKYHANGDANDKLVQWEFHEMEFALEEESVNKKSSYVSERSLSDQGSSYRLLMLCLCSWTSPERSQTSSVFSSRFPSLLVSIG